METYIARALDSAKREEIAGKAVTPYLLSTIFELTEGRSLKTNIALVESNARLAAKIAVALASS
jgi:pseudouridine-5'-phosphate glycosidase